MRKKIFCRNRLLSFKFAFKGIFHLLKYEHNAWIHLTLTIIAITLGVVLKLSSTEWSLVVIVIGLVFAAEAINSSVEKLVDFISPEYNKYAEIIKDLAAGGVLIAAIAAATVGVVVFMPKIIGLLN